MKKLIVLFVALAALFAIACTDKPEKPVCPAGQETVVGSVWVNEAPAFTTWGDWQNGDGGGHGNTATFEKKCFPEHHGCTWKHRHGVVTPAVPGYWTEPQCKTPDPEPVYTFEYKPTCDAFFYAIFKDGGEYGSGSGPWGTATTLFIVIRGDEHRAVAQPLDGDVVVGSMSKPTDCEQPEPPIIIPPKPECLEVQQPYGMAQLFGPDNQRGLMYIYPDPRTGELPQAVGVRRQLCVLGWEAEREGYFGFVYRNSCTGVYTWNGMDVTPRPDVLKHGVCARSGACQ